MPSGTPIAAAMRKPPKTRQTVMRMSRTKPCASRFQPSRSIVAGSARKVGDTKPPKVAAAHAAKNSTKNATPSATRAPGVTGFSGVKLPDVGGVDRRIDVGHRLDDADLEQELPRLLQEGLQLAGEKPAVRRAILPAQVGSRFRERFAALLHVGTHHLVGLLRLGEAFAKSASYLRWQDRAANR